MLYSRKVKPTKTASSIKKANKKAKGKSLSDVEKFFAVKEAEQKEFFGSENAKLNEKAVIFKEANERLRADTEALKYLSKKMSDDLEKREKALVERTNTVIKKEKELKSKGGRR